MDIVDAIKVEISGTGVITSKKEVKECKNSCGCKISNSESSDAIDTEQ